MVCRCTFYTSAYTVINKVHCLCCRFIYSQFSPTVVQKAQAAAVCLSNLFWRKIKQQCGMQERKQVMQLRSIRCLNLLAWKLYILIEWIQHLLVLLSTRPIAASCFSNDVEQRDCGRKGQGKGSVREMTSSVLISRLTCAWCILALVVDDNTGVVTAAEYWPGRACCDLPLSSQCKNSCKRVSCSL